MTPDLRAGLEGLRERITRLPHERISKHLVLEALDALLVSSPAAHVSVAGRLDRSLADFERACLVHLDEEQHRASPDNALIGLLCDAVRLARERVDLRLASPAAPGEGGLIDHGFASHPHGMTCSICGAAAPPQGREPLREALELCVSAIEHHEQWCGFNRQAPGDGIWWRALKAGKAALLIGEPR